MNVKDGTALIRASGFEDIAQFVAGDAFDATELAATTPPASVGIVSGLYELFPENDAVRRSLFGLSKAIGAGGYLIYTGQPWHPQLELIARSLTSHRGGKRGLCAAGRKPKSTNWLLRLDLRSLSNASTSGVSSP